MICFVCHRSVSGADWKARYEWRKKDGITLIHGKGEFPLAGAQGSLVKVSHNKCYHAEKKRLDLLAAREADPSAQPPPDSDWRHQELVDVEELSGYEGHGSNRGAGAAG